VGTPKAGVFSEGQAAVVADAIIERIHNQAPTAAYDGKGICYLEFGHDEVALVEVTFVAGEAPHGTFNAASHANADNKLRFGRERIRRWFGREWTPT
jgi:sulfide:quinone oxidoreductase